MFSFEDEVIVYVLVYVIDVNVVFHVLHVLHIVNADIAVIDRYAVAYVIKIIHRS